MIEAQSYSREEVILQGQIDADGKEIFPQIVDLLLNHPEVTTFWVKGLPGSGKTTIADGLHETIKRLTGKDPIRVSFDTIRAEYLQSVSTKDHVVTQLADLTPEQKLAFKSKVIVAFTARELNEGVYEYTIIEAPCWGDDDLGGENEVERGQSALQEIATEDWFAILDVSGTDLVYDRAIEVRTAASISPNDSTFKIFLKVMGLYEGKIDLSDDSRELIQTYLKMASPEMIKLIRDLYDKFALLGYSEMLKDDRRKGMDGLTDMALDALQDVFTNRFDPMINTEDLLAQVFKEIGATPASINGIYLSTRELWMISVRMLYSFKMLQDMGFSIIPKSEYGNQVEPNRLFHLLNQYIPSEIIRLRQQH